MLATSAIFASVPTSTPAAVPTLISNSYIDQSRTAPQYLEDLSTKGKYTQFGFLMHNGFDDNFHHELVRNGNVFHFTYVLDKNALEHYFINNYAYEHDDFRQNIMDNKLDDPVISILNWSFSVGGSIRDGVTGTDLTGGIIHLKNMQISIDEKTTESTPIYLKDVESQYDNQGSYTPDIKVFGLNPAEPGQTFHKAWQGNHNMAPQFHLNDFGNIVFSGDFSYSDIGQNVPKNLDQNSITAIRPGQTTFVLWSEQYMANAYTFSFPITINPGEVKVFNGYKVTDFQALATDEFKSFYIDLADPAKTELNELYSVQKRSVGPWTIDNEGKNLLISYNDGNHMLTIQNATSKTLELTNLGTVLTYTDILSN